MSAVFDNDVEVNTEPGSPMALDCGFVSSRFVAALAGALAVATVPA